MGLEPIIDKKEHFEQSPTHFFQLISWAPESV